MGIVATAGGLRGGPRGERRLPRLQQSDITFLGALGVNVSAHNGGSVLFSERVCAINRATGTGLFLDSHRPNTTINQGDTPSDMNRTHKLCEVNISGLTPSLTTTLQNATILQNFKDLTNDTLIYSQVSTNARPFSGEHMHGGAINYWSTVFNEWRLAESHTIWYQGSGDNRANNPNWWTHSNNFADDSTRRGGFSVQNINPIGVAQGSIVDGPACDIPSEWQPYFGGATHIVFNCEMSILSRTSPGKCAFVIRLQDLDDSATYGTGATSSAGSSPKIPATQVLGFTTTSSAATTHLENRKGQRIDWGNPFFNSMTKTTGAFFASGTSSLCFVGSTARKIIQYSAGTYQATDWVSCIWCFDVWDLIKVFNGEMEPWEPHATNILELPRHTLITDPTQTNVRVWGASYNPDDRKLYYKMRQSNPLIHVCSIGTPNPL